MTVSGVTRKNDIRLVPTPKRRFLGSVDVPGERGLARVHVPFVHCLVVLFICERDVYACMGEDEDAEPGLSDEEIEKLQEIKERNKEVGANEYTMDTDEDRDDED